MKKWDAEKFTINARLKILTRLMLNRVNRRVNAINPAALQNISCRRETARCILPEPYYIDGSVVYALLDALFYVTLLLSNE